MVAQSKINANIRCENNLTRKNKEVELFFASFPHISITFGLFSAQNSNGNKLLRNFLVFFLLLISVRLEKLFKFALGPYFTLTNFHNVENDTHVHNKCNRKRREGPFACQVEALWCAAPPTFVWENLAAFHLGVLPLELLKHKTSQVRTRFDKVDYV